MDGGTTQSNNIKKRGKVRNKSFSVKTIKRGKGKEEKKARGQVD